MIPISGGDTRWRGLVELGDVLGNRVVQMRVSELGQQRVDGQELGGAGDAINCVSIDCIALKVVLVAVA